ncbi:hypothetical protein V1478_013680 [Vespula squamosa]|uniref:Uncharacterized protein n=1 Tax=Vespula squamosa TaxID=30214 RepID=A0ABD2A5W6_VESSQ
MTDNAYLTLKTSTFRIYFQYLLSATVLLNDEKNYRSPYTVNSGSTTAVGSFLGPILHVPTG